MKTSLKERVEDIMDLLAIGSREDVILGSHILNQRYEAGEVSSNEVKYILEILFTPHWAFIHHNLLMLYDANLAHDLDIINDKEYWSKFDYFLNDDPHSVYMRKRLEKRDYT